MCTVGRIIKSDNREIARTAKKQRALKKMLFFRRKGEKTITFCQNVIIEESKTSIKMFFSPSNKKFVFFTRNAWQVSERENVLNAAQEICKPSRLIKNWNKQNNVLDLFSYLVEI